jgi:hypothetical protein
MWMSSASSAAGPPEHFENGRSLRRVAGTWALRQVDAARNTRARTLDAMASLGDAGELLKEGPTVNEWRQRALGSNPADRPCLSNVRFRSPSPGSGRAAFGQTWSFGRGWRKVRLGSDSDHFSSLHPDRAVWPLLTHRGPWEAISPPTLRVGPDFSFAARGPFLRHGGNAARRSGAPIAPAAPFGM